MPPERARTAPAYRSPLVDPRISTLVTPAFSPPQILSSRIYYGKVRVTRKSSSKLKQRPLQCPVRAGTRLVIHCQYECEPERGFPDGSHTQ